MNSYKFIFIALITLTLSACNMTLAQDVTPPPNYIAPTPIATLGNLYPTQKPNIENGKIIFQEKCVACHGESGMGDGEQGKQLPVTVAALGLPEVANQASPAKWYSIVTQGNLEKFMPPFASLSESEKWDVVTYAFTLHTTPEQIEIGKNLFEKNCANCESQFTNLESMSSISDIELMNQIKDSFGNNFSDEELSATASYIRTLTFASQSEPIVDSAPSAESTLVVSDQVEVNEEAENITGQIENRSGESFPENFIVTLRGFQHGADPNASPQEFLSQEITLNDDGSYGFAGEIKEGQIYFVQFELNGLNYQTAISVVPTNVTELTIPTLIIYETTDDFSALQIDSINISFDLANEDTAYFFTLYNFRNPSDKTILIEFVDENKIPFIAFANGSSGLGFEAAQDSGYFIPFVNENGFGIPPSEKSYGLIAFASIPNDRKIKIVQPAVLDIASATLLLPEGVKANGDTLLDNGIQVIENTNFHIYTASGFAKDSTLEFTLSGKPKGTNENANWLENQNIVLGIGVFGLALIFAGVWMFLKKKNESDFEDDDFEDSESIMDAIIALDDLHKDGKISKEAYTSRRAELKDKLKRDA